MESKLQASTHLCFFSTSFSNGKR